MPDAVRGRAQPPAQLLAVSPAPDEQHADLVVTGAELDGVPDRSGRPLREVPLDGAHHLVLLPVLDARLGHLRVPLAHREIHLDLARDRAADLDGHRHQEDDQRDEREALPVLLEQRFERLEHSAP